ncbi:YcxB family protein [Miniphocaeibacter halophilus]|uniref:YcxB family protein n=1 Tax=Miniphocaeibacter halophilus TaxID=2931922 RepID=A0AC61MSJ7_9FIRM|nr:YcxB family protein [Miniphocaeibacter halophilus]QQK08572.1 YcxB family protein [Miniphocaeibacter halophilus]
MEPELLYRNEYILKKEDLKKFYNLIFAKYKIILFTIGIVGIIIGFLFLRAKEEIIGIILLLVSIFVMGMSFYIVRYLVKKRHLNLQYIIKFYNTNLILTVGENKENIRYELIEKVLEVDDAFYLMISSRDGIIVKKKSFVKGSYNKFYDFINKKVKTEEIIEVKGG